ncbi:MAG: AbrB/MazE/SpoVT family DNA-binding domain-containing protein [Deinococcota bacterium]
MITKVFQSGNSQAVRIPKEFRLEHDEVEITQRGDELILRPIKQQSAAVAFDALVGIEGEIQRPKISVDERDW